MKLKQVETLSAAGDLELSGTDYARAEAILTQAINHLSDQRQRVRRLLHSGTRAPVAPRFRESQNSGKK